MLKFTVPILKFALVCLLVPLVITACAQIRKVTYPPDFVYLEQRQIRNTMTRLSVNIWEINDMFDTVETIAGFRRERMIELLKDMEDAAKLLGAGTKKTNHLLIDDNIDQFAADVRMAREAAEQEPPSYYLAGRLSGSCLACHVRRRTE